MRIVLLSLLGFAAVAAPSGPAQSVYSLAREECREDRRTDRAEYGGPGGRPSRAA